jgi:Cof subfamily protein (haloacid dehalogenase superfamily)
MSLVAGANGAMGAMVPAFKLILFDLDATLLREDRTISPTNLTTLKKLMQRGVKVGLATGRSLRSVKPYVDALGPNGPLILFNGARVWDISQKRFIFENHLLLEQALTALKLVRSFDDVHVNLYIDNNIFISKKTARSIESEIKDGVPHTVVGDLADWLSANPAKPVKIMLISEPSTLASFKSEFLKSKVAECSLIHSEWNYLEIMQAGVNKGQTLKKIESYYKIPTDEIIAFGDNLNDLDLIRFCGLGVAMGNAHADLKQIAMMTIGHHQTDTISDCLSGIFQEIES